MQYDGIAAIKKEYDAYRIYTFYRHSNHQHKSIPLYTMESALRHFFSEYSNIAMVEDDVFDKVAVSRMEKKNGRSNGK